jgi:hypothetical protein
MAGRLQFSSPFRPNPYRDHCTQCHTNCHFNPQQYPITDQNQYTHAKPYPNEEPNAHPHPHPGTPGDVHHEDPVYRYRPGDLPRR